MCYEWYKMVHDIKMRALVTILSLWSTSSLLYVFIIHGESEVLSYFFLIWANDISAMVVGRTIGGPKITPVISPNKTWSGFIGGIIGTIICMWLSSTDKLELKYTIFAFLIAVLGFFGDIFVSYFKRKSGVKDTGNLIPGHGGILDRFDSILFSSVVFFMGII